MKKLIFALIVCLASAQTFAWCGPGWGRPPPPCFGGGWGCGWGPGGFWPGFAGGVVGGLIGGALTRPYYGGYYGGYGRTVVVSQPNVVVQPSPVVVQQPTVIQQPVVVQQPVVQQVVRQPTQVWVPGCYVDRVEANGSVVRVWQPGHYEYR